ncbi:hypothetical protein JCM16814_04880 [Desulfobaculum senezii]
MGYRRGWFVGALVLVWLCVALPAGGGTVRAGLQPLAVVFTGNTLGLYDACETCSREGIGGLGRRATVFGDIRQEYGSRTVFIGAPYEFMHFRKGAQGASTAVARALVEAYGMLDYDLLCLAPREAAWLEGEGVLPQRTQWAVARNAPMTRVISRGGWRIGVVVFPVAKATYKGPDAPTMQAVADAAQGLRPEVDIVLGVSAWGETPEQKFMAQYDEAVDVLLGSGPGMASGYRLSPGGSTLWLRSNFDGRGVLRLVVAGDFLAANGRYVVNQHFRVANIPLDGRVKYDTAVSNLFSWL